jgi:hypothetical protein
MTCRGLENHIRSIPLSLSRSGTDQEAHNHPYTVTNRPIRNFMCMLTKRSTL